jgi:arabinose-5-phosphate isomerase
LAPLFIVAGTMLSQATSEHIARGRRVFELELAEARAVGERLDASFAEAVETMRNAAARKGKIVVVGVGKSGHIGEKIAATLTSTGTPAVMLNAMNALHGDLGIVSDGDVALILSNSGETDELVAVFPALARGDVRVIAITGNANSFLAKSAHIHIDASVSREACPLELAPTASTTAMLILGDALAMALLEARGFTRDDFARFHPGGKLGRTLLLTVEQIMRTADQMALIRPDTIIRDVLLEIARRRAGCAVAVNPEGRLAGIFTQGDFARHLASNPNLLELNVEPFLTKKPITVQAGGLAVEVLHILEKHRIDDLVVVDGGNRPIGMVDTQDLARFRLV